MASKYFENFPNVFYPREQDPESHTGTNDVTFRNVLVKDITRRSTISARDAGSPFLFYPYQLNDQLRSDHIAEYYYKDSELEWLIMMSNQIIDPYFGWYNTDETLDKGVIEKFVTTEIAKSKVKFYINNWADDDTILTKSFYDNTLPKALRKYWEPVYSAGLEITGYRRKQEDIIINTNQILALGISANNSSIPLEGGELVSFKATGTEEQLGVAEIETANSTVIRVKNISGNTVANSTVIKDVVGWTSTANVSINNSNTWHENISNTEFVYFSPMYFYDWEQEVNEQRKNLLLVGDAHHQQFSSEFELLMKTGVNEETGLSEG